jgi:hypothetical protein
MPARSRHTLSEIDAVACSAVCAVCGPARIRKKYVNPKTGKQYWLCVSQQRERRPCYSDSGEAWLMKRYGLSRADFDAMAAAQDGECALCRKVPRKLHVDHCHETGRVRGLLCPRCNTALGALGDTEDGLLAALRYIRAV